MLRQQKRLEDALEAYGEALHIDPRQSIVHNIQGDILRELKRPSEALAAYEDALACDSTMAIAHYNKADILFRDFSAYEQARQAYEQAIQCAPNPVIKGRAYIGKGEVCRSMNDYEEALQAYLQAISLNPNNAKLYAAKGDIFRRLGKEYYEAARTAYDEAIRLDTSNGELFFKKGNILKLMSKMKEAQFAHERARELGYGR